MIFCPQMDEQQNISKYLPPYFWVFHPHQALTPISQALWYPVTSFIGVSQIRVFLSRAKRQELMELKKLERIFFPSPLPGCEKSYGNFPEVAIIAWQPYLACRMWLRPWNILSLEENNAIRPKLATSPILIQLSFFGSKQSMHQTLGMGIFWGNKKQTGMSSVLSF